MEKILSLMLKITLGIGAVGAVVFMIIVTIGLLGGIPHVDIQDGRYEMNVNGVVNTVDVQNYNTGFIVIDNGVPVNFEMYDITKYYSDSTLYTMAFTKKRNNFVLLNKDIVITFKKI